MIAVNAACGIVRCKEGRTFQMEVHCNDITKGGRLLTYTSMRTANCFLDQTRENAERAMCSTSGRCWPASVYHGSLMASWKEVNRCNSRRCILDMSCCVVVVVVPIETQAQSQACITIDWNSHTLTTITLLQNKACLSGHVSACK